MRNLFEEIMLGFSELKAERLERNMDLSAAAQKMKDLEDLIEDQNEQIRFLTNCLDEVLDVLETITGRMENV